MSPPWKSSEVWASWRNRSQHSFLAWDKARNMSLDVTSLDWPFSFFRRFSAPQCRHKQNNNCILHLKSKFWGSRPVWGHQNEICLSVIPCFIAQTFLANLQSLRWHMGLFLSLLQSIIQLVKSYMIIFFMINLRIVVSIITLLEINHLVYKIMNVHHSFLKPNVMI